MNKPTGYTEKIKAAIKSPVFFSFKQSGGTKEYMIYPNGMVYKTIRTKVIDAKTKKERDNLVTTEINLINVALETKKEIYSKINAGTST